MEFVNGRISRDDRDCRQSPSKACGPPPGANCLQNQKAEDEVFYEMGPFANVMMH